MLQQNSIPCDVEAYVHIDDDVVTEADIESAIDLITVDQPDSDPDGEQEESSELNLEIDNARQALSTVNDLISYATHVNSSTLFSLLYQTKSCLDFFFYPYT